MEKAAPGMENVGAMDGEGCIQGWGRQEAGMGKLCHNAN